MSRRPKMTLDELRALRPWWTKLDKPEPPIVIPENPPPRDFVDIGKLVAALERRRQAPAAEPSRISALDLLAKIQQPDARMAHLAGGFDWGLPMTGIPNYESTTHGPPSSARTTRKACAASRGRRT